MGKKPLYSSNNHLTPDDPRTPVREDALFRYHVNLELLRTKETLGASITFKDQFPLREADGSALRHAYHNMQGGVFAPWGDLFLVNGLANHTAHDDHGGIHIFAPSGALLQDSTNGSGAFNYQYSGDFPHYQEPEGLDWWDLDTVPHTRGSGQLHVIMVSHANLAGHRHVVFGDDCGSPCHHHDRFFWKHYDIALSQGALTLHRPMHEGYRLDVCWSFGTVCGLPVADAWCQQHGFSYARQFEVEPFIGDFAPTITLGSGEICDDWYCGGFATISCGLAGIHLPPSDIRILSNTHSPLGTRRRQVVFGA